MSERPDPPLGKAVLKTILTPAVAAVAAFFLQQVWWLRGIEGAAFGAFVFVAIPAAINWVSSRSNVVMLRVDCVVDFLPTRLPNEGRVVTVNLFSPAEVPHQAGTSMEKYGDPGTITGWPQNSHAYKCEVRNPNAAIIFDVGITLTVDFNEVVRSKDNPKEFHSGVIARSGTVSIVAPRLEERTTFVFYVANLRPYFATVTSINATFAHPDRGQPLIKISQNPWRNMTFSPFGS